MVLFIELFFSVTMKTCKVWTYFKEVILEVGGMWILVLARGNFSEHFRERVWNRLLFRVSWEQHFNPSWRGKTTVLTWMSLTHACFGLLCSGACCCCESSQEAIEAIPWKCHKPQYSYHREVCGGRTQLHILELVGSSWELEISSGW